MNFYSNLPQVSLSQLDGKIKFYDIKRKSDRNFKNNNINNFSNFLDELGNLSPYLKKISINEIEWLHKIKHKNFAPKKHL